MSDIATELAERAARRLWKVRGPLKETAHTVGRLLDDPYGERDDWVRHIADIIADVITEYVSVNADLLAACEAAYILLAGDARDGHLGHHKDNPVPAQLRAAIAKARKQ